MFYSKHPGLPVIYRFAGHEGYDGVMPGRSAPEPAHLVNRGQVETSGLGRGVLFMHEVHKVRGRAEDEFEAAFREGWMPTLAAGDDARLLWYANHAHGSGPAYTVVTVTAVRDGPAWERLALRVQKGDLRQWMRELDELRHDVEAKLLVPLVWSPLQELDLDEMPVDGREHELTLYMEDTMWPYEDKFDEYIDRCGEVYAKSIDRPDAAADDRSRISAGPRQPPAPRSGVDAAHPSNRRRCSNCFKPRLPPNTAPAARGCTTPWSCAISGQAGCCGPRRGHRCFEPRMNIGTIIDAAAAGDPDRAALIIDGRTISYGELAAAVGQCAARLAAEGLAGMRVAVVDVGSMLSIATMLGAARIGAAAALMNPALTPPELRGLLANAGCATVGVAGEAYTDRLREAGAAKVLTVADLLGDGPASAAPPAGDVDDREALVLFTSGTTGLPKAIGITNGQLSARIGGVTAPFRADTPPTVSMMCVPFFHVGGAIGTLGNLYSGNTYVVQDRFDAGEWLRLVQEHRVASHIHGADDAPANPRPSRLRQHRPVVPFRHRVRGGRRAPQLGASGDGRDAACGVCQCVRSDRDPRRLHHPVARRPPRPRPRRFCGPSVTGG